MVTTFMLGRENTCLILLDNIMHFMISLVLIFFKVFIVFSILIWSISTRYWWNYVSLKHRSGIYKSIGTLQLRRSSQWPPTISVIQVDLDKVIYSKALIMGAHL